MGHKYKKVIFLERSTWNFIKVNNNDKLGKRKQQIKNGEVALVRNESPRPYRKCNQETMFTFKIGGKSKLFRGSYFLEEIL